MRRGFVLLVLVVVMAACTSGEDRERGTNTTMAPESTVVLEPTTSPQPPTPTTTLPTNTSPETIIPGFELTYAVFSELPSTNPWFLNSIHRPPIYGVDFHPDPGRGPVEHYPAYNVARGGSLYQLIPPKAAVAPLIAREVPGRAVREDDSWTVVIRLRSDATWSDGTPLTAHDAAFTFETLSDSRWNQDFDWFGGVQVEAASDHRLRLTFDRPPTVHDWMYGVGRAPILPAHFWQAHIDEAIDFTQLAAPTGADAPTAGPYRLTGAGPGEYVLEAVKGFWNRGTSYGTHVSGRVQYASATGFGDEVILGGDTIGFTVGPYAERLTVRVFDTQDAAIFAMQDGAVDTMLVPGGIRRGFSIEISLEDTTEYWNLDSGVRLALIGESVATDSAGERRAIACLVDKQWLAESVLEGIVAAAYSFAPGTWYDSPIPPCVAPGSLGHAASTLGSVGWTWDMRPSGHTHQPGEATTARIDSSIPPSLTVASVGPGYDPLIATYGLYLDSFLSRIGLLTEEPLWLSFSEMALKDDPLRNGDLVIVQLDPGDARALDAIFEPNGPVTTTPDIAEALVEVRSAQTSDALHVAFDQLTSALSADSRVIPLYVTLIEEWFHEDVVPPFDVVLDGFQAYGGMPALVKPAD